MRDRASIRNYETKIISLVAGPDDHLILQAYNDLKKNQGPDSIATIQDDSNLGIWIFVLQSKNRPYKVYVHSIQRNEQPPGGWVILGEIQNNPKTPGKVLAHNKDDISKKSKPGLISKIKNQLVGDEYDWYLPVKILWHPDDIEVSRLCVFCKRGLEIDQAPKVPASM